MHPAAPEPLRLLGRWRFERVVEDGRSGQRSEVHGAGSITRASATRLVWHETGTWTRSGIESPVARTHLLDLVELDGDSNGQRGWVVLFDDERLFHPWAPGTEVVHPCGEDTYVGRYDLGGLAEQPERWVTRWHCTGPAKDYVLTTTWTRSSAPE